MNETNYIDDFTPKVEENLVRTIQKSFSDYKKTSIEKIRVLENDKKVLINKLSFYLFENRITNGTLSEEIKKVFDIKNIDNTRLFDIIELRKAYNLTLDEEIIPVEVKFIIKELS